MISSMKFKLAIIGHGFVGKAVDYGFSHPSVKKQLIDPNYGTTIKDIDLDTELIFICVPTPYEDFTIFRSVMDELKERGFMKFGAVAIKSTVPPHVLRDYKNSTIVYNPEFLTEKSAAEQFIDPPFHIFGGDVYSVNRLERYYHQYSLCNPCPSYKLSLEEASVVKYTINSFLATKVTFFNQIYKMCLDNGYSFNHIVNAVGADPRIGRGHTKVPGFDGKLGFGGACFPKDTQAFVNFSEQLSVLEAAIEANNKIRAGYDLDDREKDQKIVYNR